MIKFIQSTQNYFFNKTIRTFSTQTNISDHHLSDRNITSNRKIEEEWNSAIPYERIPGPTKWSFTLSFLPAGKYYKSTLFDLHHNLRSEYGSIIKLPGQFGRRDIILILDPLNFEKILRNDGPYPIRRGLDSIEYYRKVIRRDVFKSFHGLVAEQGERWAEMRAIINPVMMNPKSVKLYIPSIDDVSKSFVERIKKIRDPITEEMPKNFENEINRWSLETVGLLALDTRLGLINGNTTKPNAEKAIEAFKNFFLLLHEVDFEPSLWKYVQTPTFRKLIQTMDTVTDITNEYVNEARIRLQNKNYSKADSVNESSVLEKLLKIAPDVAHIMAMDFLLAGVDTTTSGFVSCLYQLAKNPIKQNNLRDELRTVLNEKNSSLTTENMKNMPYLRACIKEAFRLSPVTIGTFRTAAHNLVLSGYQIPEGTDLAMNGSLLQKEDYYYPEALSFIPERWLRNSNKNSSCISAKSENPFIYLPFGFGPRTCIGKRFAEMLIEVLVTRIIRNFHVQWHYPDIVYKSNFINVPTGHLQFKFSNIIN